jgi:hypothetical protein
MIAACKVSPSLKPRSLRLLVFALLGQQGEQRIDEVEAPRWKSTVEHVIEAGIPLARRPGHAEELDGRI